MPPKHTSQAQFKDQECKQVSQAHTQHGLHQGHKASNVSDLVTQITMLVFKQLALALVLARLTTD